METIFPTHQGYNGSFVVGFRKDPDDFTAIERTGTVVLKRTYDIDTATGMLIASQDPVPVFMQDQPDNLLLNSDFESDIFDDESNPIDWFPEGAIIAQLLDPSPPNENHFLQVNGDANARVVQTIAFDEPLGGRQFVFSFSASSDAAAEVVDARLEADGNDAVIEICPIDASLSAVTARFSAIGMWPNDLQSTEMRVALRMADSAARTVFYENVQVEERSYETVWNSATTLRYEHDLAAFKPDGDVIVLGFAGILGTNQVIVDGQTWLSRTVASNTPPEKALFGWEPREKSPRLDEAGEFPTEPDAYPLDAPLPADFDNRFYNGHRRSNVDENITESLPASSYLPSNAVALVRQPGPLDYTVRLNGEVISARYFFFSGTGDDAQANWQSGPVTMRLDTLVIEPEEDRCYIVWRGVWPFDDRPEDSYRQLLVEAL